MCTTQSYTKDTEKSFEGPAYSHRILVEASLARKQCHFARPFHAGTIHVPIATKCGPSGLKLSGPVLWLCSTLRSD